MNQESMDQGLRCERAGSASATFFRKGVLLRCELCGGSLGAAVPGSVYYKCLWIKGL